MKKIIRLLITLLLFCEVFQVSRRRISINIASNILLLTMGYHIAMLIVLCRIVRGIFGLVPTMVYQNTMAIRSKTMTLPVNPHNGLPSNRVVAMHLDAHKRMGGIGKCWSKFLG
jgi:hypothetical protein